MATAEAGQLRALVAANRRADDPRRAMAVHADPAWTGPELLEGADVPIRVVACASPLAVREVLLGHERRDELLLLLTPCTGADLGLDVRARLVKGDVLPIDPFSSVLALFRATILDPQLAQERHRWLIGELIALAPTGGWPERQPLGGVLDADTAWRTWEGLRLGILQPPAGLADVLALSGQPQVEQALAVLEPERRRGLVARWGADVPEPTGIIVDLLADGRGGDLVSFGLVAQVLWGLTDDPALAQRQTVARVRLEPVLGRDRLDARSAAAWGTAAATALEGNPAASADLDAADRILATAGAAELAVLSDDLPHGFDARLAVLGAALAARNLDACLLQLTALHRHRQATRRVHRVEMAKAAVRLLRRSLRPPPGTAPTTFAAAALAYAADGSWVDEALRLLAEGDQVSELTDAYRTLVATVEAERLDAASRFAQLLAQWSRSEPVADQRLVPVEQILEQIVAPVARAAPVLMVVCDGMGLQVAHRLIRDLLAEGWAPAGPAGQPAWPVGVAVLPTVTEASRTSLLTGQRLTGAQPEERVGFAAHPALRRASSSTHPPVLRHKRDLVGPSGLALPDEMRRLVADPDQRVVGVVVNAIDDHLARGDQIRVGWDLVSLRPLSWLLDAAADAGRVVVLTADHGHVLDGGRARQRQYPTGGGERWRTGPPPAGEGEVEVAGPRVLLGGGRVILPVDDRLRYGVPKHGYHGGASPEEVLVPVEVLARQLPQGWVHRPTPVPSWWTGEIEIPARAPLPVVRRGAVSAPVGQASLFDSPRAEAPSTGGRRWIDELLGSPAFGTSRQRARVPRPLPDERIRRYLEAIDANGGSIPLAALSSRTGEPADTLRMALTQVQRLVNLDGAEVLAVRSDGSVELDRVLLAVQFELSPEICAGNDPSPGAETAGP